MAPHEIVIFLPPDLQSPLSQKKVIKSEIRKLHINLDINIKT
jgi:hypothetical protein